MNESSQVTSTRILEQHVVILCLQLIEEEDSLDRWGTGVYTGAILRGMRCGRYACCQRLLADVSMSLHSSHQLIPARSDHIVPPTENRTRCSCAAPTPIGASWHNWDLEVLHADGTVENSPATLAAFSRLRGWRRGFRSSLGKANGHTCSKLFVVFPKDRMIIVCWRRPGVPNEETWTQDLLAHQNPYLNPYPRYQDVGRISVNGNGENIIRYCVEVHKRGQT